MKEDQRKSIFALFQEYFCEKVIKEKYPGAVSSQPTKKTSNGNTGKDGKKSGKGKGEKNGNKKLKIKAITEKKRITLTNVSSFLQTLRFWGTSSQQLGDHKETTSI